MRGVMPAYFADFWGREQEYAAFRSRASATYVRAEDDQGVPETVDDRGRLAALKAPALVLVGRHDFICGVRWAEELHTLIPHSELVIFEHSGHFAHIEEPGLFSETIEQFVATHTPNARRSRFGTPLTYGPLVPKTGETAATRSEHSRSAE
ncbi:alpha/beta fold hydrolase [Streptomyces atratus]|uniref:alpha/beta fold hydrolase n=1 Tax=Streptomyces atratus TaxID=1893 RepID=UPI00225BB8F9|nr:alpha/beta hydrolase [Streptomyces atratus]MCX5338708.1 alpha/beta hydrolase [Streptomyces atratus]